MLLLTYFLQRGLQQTPLMSASEFAPMAAGTAVTSVLGTRLVRHYGRSAIIAGAGLILVGIVSTFLVVRSDPASLLALQPGLVLYGVGSGLVAPSIVRLVLAETPAQDAGAASGGLLTAIQASNAAGVATIGAFFAALRASGDTYTGAFAASLLVLCLLFAGVLATLLTFRKT